MAEIVFAFNEHPTEAIAGVHARQVARILREEYGHGVVFHKFNWRKTNFGIVKRCARGELSPEQAVKKLLDLDSSRNLAQKLASKYNRWCFNFHASESDTLHERGWELRGNRESSRVVEVRGEFTPISTKLDRTEPIMQALSKIRDAAIKSNSEEELKTILRDMQTPYQLKVARNYGDKQSLKKAREIAIAIDELMKNETIQQRVV